MIVYAIIGPCGAGKTTLISKVPGSIHTHKEGYVQKDDEIAIDNKTYLSKLRYLSSWYMEMIKLERERNRKIVSDRCPYDVCAYVRDQHMQHKMVQEYMRELEACFDIEVRTIYLRVPFDVAQKRVAERLLRQAWRIAYHEDDDGFLKHTWQYYEDHIGDWNHTIENVAPLESGLDKLLRIVR